MSQISIFCRTGSIQPPQKQIVFTFHKNEEVAHPDQGRCRQLPGRSRKAFEAKFTESVRRDCDTAVQGDPDPA